MVSVTNGWDDVQRLNHAYTVGTQLAMTPTKTTSVFLNFIHGPERREDSHDQRSVHELVATWKLLPKLALGGDGLYGHEENGVAVGHDALWKGLAGYAKYSLTSKFSLAFRGEVFNDGGGTRTGTNQTLQGFTFTPEYDMNLKFSRLRLSLPQGGWKICSARRSAAGPVENKSVFLEGSRRHNFRQRRNVIHRVRICRRGFRVIT